MQKKGFRTTKISQYEIRNNCRPLQPKVTNLQFSNSEKSHIKKITKIKDDTTEILAKSQNPRKENIEGHPGLLQKNEIVKSIDGQCTENSLDFEDIIQPPDCTSTPAPAIYNIKEDSDDVYTDGWWPQTTPLAIPNYGIQMGYNHPSMYGYPIGFPMRYPMNYSFNVTPEQFNIYRPRNESPLFGRAHPEDQYKFKQSICQPYMCNRGYQQIPVPISFVPVYYPQYTDMGHFMNGRQSHINSQSNANRTNRKTEESVYDSSGGNATYRGSDEYS